MSNMWKRFRRSPYQAIAAVFMMFITLFVIGTFFILIAGSSAILSYFESKPQLTVFLKSDKDEQAAAGLTDTLKASGKVATITYVSQEQALAIYREQNKDDPLLLEMVTADILPASLDVSAIAPVYLSALADVARQDPVVDEVVFQKDVVDTLLSWTSTVRKVGIVFIFFLMFSTFLILFTSIGMKIAMRREEIGILRLVGATNWYIRKPFILEGLMYGWVGAFTSSVLVSILILYSQPYLSSFLRGIPTLSLVQIPPVMITVWPPSLTFYVLVWLLLTTCGLVIGLVGSMFAVSRYMR